MKRAAVLVSLLTSSALAHAEPPTVSLVPSCAEIDVEHDALAPADREAAQKLLVRALERADLLVVEAGCTDHYIVSHEAEGDEITIHLQGPHGRRRMRHVKQADLAAGYARMIGALMASAAQEAADAAFAAAPAPGAPDAAAPEAAPEAAPDASPVAYPQPAPDRAPYLTQAAVDNTTYDPITPDDADHVKPERILYGQLGIGTYGTNYALGYRRGDRNHALDMSIAWAGDSSGSFVAASVEGLYMAAPHSSSTPYIGAGLSLASQHEGDSSGAGMRIEATAGIEFARSSALHWFTQVDLALPTYDVGMITAPTGSISLGAGF